jgi:hypothetical protein
MFSISADQTQWFHLYRVQKAYPTMFVLFCSAEVNESGSSSKYLDLRIVSGTPNIMGNSWCVRSQNDYRMQVNRADCTKFLELRARFLIATAMARGIDQVELIESSRDELALAISLDETLRNNFAAIAPTLYPKMARDLINGLGVDHTGLVYEEMPDWASRNMDDPQESQPARESIPMAEPLTTKTQRVPV